MNKTAFSAVLGAVALVSACNKQPETVSTTADPAANVVANAAPIELPPALAASKTYRCKDNSVVSIDWYADKKSAAVKTDPNGTPVKLTAAKEGDALKAEGFALIGLPTAKAVTLTVPGKGAQACRA